ncbi:MAG: alcohol dehydrogenase catalytic domain-containing protein [Thermoproteota archaeon]|nr:alcohol dehydrogenase catalytic domain-containing protein [Thermoproteota archaeon]
MYLLTRMKALYFEKPGMDNLKYGDVRVPELKDTDVMLETKCLGVNPIDYFTITGIHGANGPSMHIEPYPHIAGSEISGIVKRKGERVKNGIREGDRVIVYNRIFDGSCRFCKKGYEMLCDNGGLVGVKTNGGFAEYVNVPSSNLIKIPDGISWELAASLPTAALTAYNAVKESKLKSSETMVVFGGSGNTGIFCVQLGNLWGGRVVAVSKKPWLKEYGAAEVLEYNGNLKETVKDITEGQMADVVINSLGEKAWRQGMEVAGKMGRIITFGVLSGGNLQVDGRFLYNNQVTIKGTTGGTMKDMLELVEIVKGHNLNVKIWQRYPLEHSKKAVESIFDSNRDGRILITNT